MSWPLLVGCSVFEPMPPKIRVVHVRKHLLNPSERWWEVSSLKRSEIRELARDFAHAGFPCGDGAKGTPCPEASDWAAKAHQLHDTAYEPVYRRAFDALMSDEVTFQSCGPDVLAFDALELALTVVAKRHEGRFAVVTAYRARTWIKESEARRRRLVVRHVQFAASNAYEAPEGVPCGR